MENKYLDVLGPKISIVIAAYNVGKYLAEAIDSCLNQTYKNIEVIVVNDASPDDSGAVAESCAAKDAENRVRVIHHEKNRGSLAARRTGTEAATGEYIMYLDGDDYFESYACEDLANLVLEKRPDVLQFGFNLVEIDGVLESHLRGLETFTAPYMGSLAQGEGALVKACFQDRLFGWNFGGKLWLTKIAKKAFSLIGDFRLILAEDTLFSFVALIFARNYAAMDKKLYNYRQGSGCTAPGQKKGTKIRNYAETYMVVSELERITRLLKYEKRYESEVAFVRRAMTENMAWYFLTEVEEQDAASAIKCLLEYWPKELLLSAISVACCRDNFVPKTQMMKWVRQAPCFEVKTKEIKTVGMFYYHFYNGGIERVASLLSQILAKAGYQIVLFADEKDNQDDYPFPEGTKRVVLPKQNPKNLKECSERMYAWSEGIEKNHVDVMIYHAWVNNDLTIDHMAIRSNGIPIILHTHGDYALGHNFQDSLQNELFSHQREFYALVNAVVALSEMDEYWYRMLGFNCLRTINPVPFDCETTKPAKLEGKDVLWVGRLCDQKQPIEALKIMEVVHESEPTAVLHMLGKAEEWMEKNVKDYIEAHNMADYVVLEGFSTNVAPFYENSAVMLWTAYFEGMPVGMMESKVYGLPMVSYEIANLDMIRNPKGMIVTAQKDYRAAAEAVVKLLQDEDYRKKLGAEARKDGEAMTSFDIAAHWKKIFAMALTEKPADRLISEETVESAAIRFMLEAVAGGQKKWSECVSWQSGQIWNYQQSANQGGAAVQPDIVNHHEAMLCRHEEVVNRHEGSINHQWEIQQWHTDWLNGLESRMNAVEKRNIIVRILRKLKRMLIK